MQSAPASKKEWWTAASAPSWIVQEHCRRPERGVEHRAAAFQLGRETTVQDHHPLVIEEALKGVWSGNHATSPTPRRHHLVRTRVRRPLATKAPEHRARGGVGYGGEYADIHGDPIP